MAIMALPRWSELEAQCWWVEVWPPSISNNQIFWETSDLIWDWKRPMMLERQMSAGNRLVLALRVSYPKCGFSEISLKTATTQNEEVYIQSLPRGWGWEIQQTKEQQFVNEKRQWYRWFKHIWQEKKQMLEAFVEIFARIKEAERLTTQCLRGCV